MVDGMETTKQNGNASWSWGGIVLSTLLFVGGIGIGVWATQNFLLERPLPEKQFEPGARMATSVQERQPQKPPTILNAKTHLDPKAYVGPRGYSRVTDAVLLNGGGSAESNYFSHHLHIRMIHELLLRRGLSKKHIAVFRIDDRSSASYVGMSDEQHKLQVKESLDS